MSRERNSRLTRRQFLSRVAAWGSITATGVGAGRLIAIEKVRREIPGEQIGGRVLWDRPQYIDFLNSVDASDNLSEEPMATLARSTIYQAMRFNGMSRLSSFVATNAIHQADGQETTCPQAAFACTGIWSAGVRGTQVVTPMWEDMVEERPDLVVARAVSAFAHEAKHVSVEKYGHREAENYGPLGSVKPGRRRGLVSDAPDTETLAGKLLYWRNFPLGYDRGSIGIFPQEEYVAVLAEKEFAKELSDDGLESILYRNILRSTGFPQFNQAVVNFQDEWGKLHPSMTFEGISRFHRNSDRYGFYHRAGGELIGIRQTPPNLDRSDIAGLGLVASNALLLMNGSEDLPYRVYSDLRNGELTKEKIVDSAEMIVRYREDKF